MKVFTDTIYWGILISVGSYTICSYIQKKTHLNFLNPLLFSTIFTILFLVVFNIDYQLYFNQTNFLYYLLSPATVCLAIPLYEQIKTLKKHIRAVLLGIISGILTSMLMVMFFSLLFHFSHSLYVTLLPKSITAAIAMSISQEMGGIPSLTVPIVIMTGITGHVISDKMCKMFRITDPIAKGIAIGSASHAMGTAKALEMGEVEGAMSSLSIAVSGIITVICIFLFVHIY